MPTAQGSAASDRLLSTARHVLGSTRLRLKPENFESLIFLKYNLRTVNGEKTPLADCTPPTIADCHHMSSTRASRIRRTMRNVTLTSLMMKKKFKQRSMMIDRPIINILFMLYLRVSVADRGVDFQLRPSRGQLYFNRGRAKPRNKLVYRGQADD